MARLRVAELCETIFELRWETHLSCCSDRRQTSSQVIGPCSWRSHPNVIELGSYSESCRKVRSPSIQIVQMYLYLDQKSYLIMIVVNLITQQKQCILPLFVATDTSTKGSTENICIEGPTFLVAGHGNGCCRGKMDYTSTSATKQPTNPTFSVSRSQAIQHITVLHCLVAS